MALGNALLSHRATRLGPLTARLATLDPTAVLRRGYAIALDDAGRAVTRAQDLAVGAPLRLVLSEGAAGVRVESLQSEGPDGVAGAH